MTHAEVLTKTRVSFNPLTPVIGAEVEGVDLREPLDEETAATLRQGLLKHKVLFLRDQPISDEEQIRFTRIFGAVTPGHPISDSQKEHLEIKENVKTRQQRVRNEQIDPEVSRLRRARRYISRGWHTDITFVANPASVSVLRGIQIPPVGGDTLWVDLEAAYEGLSPAFKKLADGLQVVHGAGERPQGSEERAPRRDGREAGPFASLHPLVRVHPETGKKALFISPGFVRHIAGVKEGESEALLDYLIREVTARQDYQVRFRWTRDSIAIWDNRNTAHVGPIDGEHFNDERIVRRTTVGGEAPVGADGFVSRPLIGELFNVIS